MNDRFRFRAWDKQDKELIYEAENTYDCQSYNGHIIWHDNFAGLLDDEERYTVEQCTGLKDKNGRLIYEGDILDFDLSIPKNGGHYRGIVYWQKQNNLIGWMISSLRHTGSWDIRQIAHPNDWMTWAEVIGNIHENPELLEDK